MSGDGWHNHNASYPKFHQIPITAPALAVGVLLMMVARDCNDGLTKLVLVIVSVSVRSRCRCSCSVHHTQTMMLTMTATIWLHSQCTAVIGFGGHPIITEQLLLLLLIALFVAVMQLIGRVRAIASPAAVLNSTLMPMSIGHITIHKHTNIQIQIQI